ncbi:acetamidase [Boeremia exigua]|uniref:acetamidase n=1 Tax=Boeremia exigua TaxID=749465 RepID=UPI001E8E6B45|nr:acetamidase [Boeremia exigua]KAH6644858.1 acetamidase [Boeremia exigua]
MANPTPKWQSVSWQKKDQQFARIPAQWRLSQLPPSNVTSYLGVPRACGLLTAKELDITEKYDATALARAIREKKLSCVDVTTAFCKRAAIAHQLTNCLTEIFFDDALKRAAELDAHLTTNKPLGLLHGVPISLKDMFNVRGYDSSLGLAALSFKPATENSVLVDLLLSAGAVLYCKTNVPQTLMAFDSHNNVFGRTINPISTAITAGGSSGGEGALLAMRGSVLGVGTDIGGSIRVPSMCGNLYGVKPSADRIPLSHVEAGALPGMTKVGLTGSAGPMGHSMRDMDLFFQAVSDQKPWAYDPDAVPLPWTPLPGKKLRIGIVRRDGVIEPLPPIARLLDEAKSKLQKAGIEVVEMDIAAQFAQCSALANAMFNVEGGNAIFDLLDAGEEPLSPWLSTRVRRGKMVPFDKLQALHGKREKLRKECLQMWRHPAGEIDAFICPVAPHPVPAPDRYNGANYTSSFVLLDYSAGTIPVRTFTHADKAGEVSGKVLGSWDKVNRALCKSPGPHQDAANRIGNEVDREVYVGSPLCVQVVAPRLQDERLVHAMSAIDAALRVEAKVKAQL